uniref:Uncharacterized protein n=1 Tax=Rhizophora mucronata TaxID=61149 RepID=A0A2P2QU84_RHIMU
MVCYDENIPKGI